MRLPWLALFCVGTGAFCQSPQGQKVDPDKLFQMPDKFTQSGPDFKTFKSPPPMKHDFILDRPPMVLPRMKPDSPQIDPKIIIRPPWHGQSNGQDVAHHLYPNLKFLPLQRGPRTPR